MFALIVVAFVVVLIAAWIIKSIIATFSFAHDLATKKRRVKH